MDSSDGKNDGIHGKTGLENNGDFVINVGCCGGGRSDVGSSGGAEKEEKICRVCQMSSDCVSQSGDLIQLGCRCRNDLGTAHRNCAELWFAMKGNRVCEICGVVARNVTGVGDSDFMLEWNDMPRTSYFHRSTKWRYHHVCTCVAAILFVALTIHWILQQRRHSP
ncbi:uncharacterized protein [Elaeis guineensis]|uniref:uncharacterized protein n=1 Tax=Elaeis guineensis var. tenera TaxID=51953 RepID=UPI003C6CF821